MHSFHRAQGLRLWESGEGVLNLSDIRRLYVRKKEGFRQGEESLTRQLREVLGDRISDSAVSGVQRLYPESAVRRNQRDLLLFFRTR